MPPIKPSEVDPLKTEIPDAVFDVFNQLIHNNWSRDRAVIKQCDAVNALVHKLSLPPEELFKLKYLDIEEAYKAVGWKVVYDKPGFNETYYEPTFTFTPKG